MASIGTDTVRAGGAVTPEKVRTRAPGWSWTTTVTEAGRQESGGWRRLESGATLHVGATPNGLAAWVEGSVPKALRGENTVAASVNEARECVEGWVAEAGEWVEFTEPARVTRLDIVRDFPGVTVGTMRVLMAGFAGAPIDGNKVRAAYRDRGLRGAETVFVRTRTAGGGRVYDKGHESGGLVRDTLRFEAQERGRRSKVSGLTLATLAEEDLPVWGRERFAWCGFDRPVTGSALVAMERALASGVSGSQAVRVVGWQVAVANGYEPAVSASTGYRLRRLAREHGVPLVVPDADDTVLRLDFEKGLQHAA